jgi:Zn-dependent peptidase ImmA (M78 family)
VTKNIILLPATKVDIDERIERVLRGLGNPEPPLRLEDVRELLKLDLAYYTASDPGIAREAVSRIRVAAIQVFNRPTLIIDAIRKFSLKALYLPDRRRIMLDNDEPKAKHRWSEAHEAGHSLLPWHEAMMHGDNQHTLSQSCMDNIEAEANFAAGRLLFLRDRFVEEAKSSALEINTVKQLHKKFGNTLASTLWRFVESVGMTKPIVGLMSCHPHVSRQPMDYDPAKPCKHFIQSDAFQARFSRLSEVEIFAAIRSYCGPQRGGILGNDELILDDDNGTPHRFIFETFYNGYDALTLGVYVEEDHLKIAVGGF